MKVFLFVGLLFVSSASYGALDLMQSSPSIKWETISNDSVELIYPDYLGVESVYIANLVEHYSKVVGQTYGIQKPQKFDLIIRPELAEPNGYVTLMPRRSEWYASSMFSPYVGSTEWYQTLSIHEYRHVNQFDYFNRNGAKLLYYVMGDFGREVALFLAVPSWFMEGDAVWTETKYTDGGRGRSPRFLARLKGLVTSGQIPTFDQFLNGTYKTSLPNQYVYGYALVSYGVNKYGEELWPRVLERASRIPNPFGLYNAFWHVTGETFAHFYDEAMNDLRTRWSKDASQNENIVDYRDNLAPFKVGDAIYYVNQTLDTPAVLYKEEKGKTTEVAELAYYKELIGLNIGKNKAVYTEFLPDKRYLNKGSSDLILIDLESGHRSKITDGERLYFPGFNASQTKIMATDFKADQSWNISEFDLNGKILQSFSLSEGKIAQAHYLDDDHAVVLLNSKTGYKSLVVVDLKSHQITKTLLEPSRNLLNSLYVDSKNNLFFEAQYKGSTDIFKMSDDGFSRCTESRLGAYMPSSDGKSLYYSDMDSYGSHIAVQSLEACHHFEKNELVDFHYLGTGPSDNYNEFSIQSFPDQETLFTADKEKYQPKPYGDFDSRLLIPHTWGLYFGRGAGLGFQSDNFLRTLSASGLVGTDPEEGQSFAGLSFDFKKFYPLFNIQAGVRHREVSEFETSDKLDWKENFFGASMTLPYLKKMGLYNLTAYATGEANYTDASEYQFNNVDMSGSNYFYKTSASAGFSWNKDKHARSILSPWLLSYQIRYDDAKQPTNSQESSYRIFEEAILNTPSIFANDGFMFVYDHQRQEDDPQSYRFLPVENFPNGYVFSRGYAYQNVPEYQKYSANYVFPVAYPDWNIPNWYYLRRVYSTFFFDSTFVTDQLLHDTLNSYGAEIELESVVFRLVPLTFGARILEKMKNDETKVEGFVALNVTY
ncbi:MAG TPA: hypothetical protein VF412_12725 [Bdellovibrio sp.]|uniref:hypothetical protein n=1 Tax=Bdellovibrio sp. TaxID=28201 RepID=UPI002F03AFCB